MEVQTALQRTARKRGLREVVQKLRRVRQLETGCKRVKRRRRMMMRARLR